jgi:hypothetical protein
MIGAAAAGDGEQPGAEEAARSIAGQGDEGVEEDLGGDVLGRGRVSDSTVGVAVYPLGVPLVDGRKGLGVVLRPPHQVIICGGPACREILYLRLHSAHCPPFAASTESIVGRAPK